MADEKSKETEVFQQNLIAACEEWGSTQRIIRQSGVSRNFLYRILRGESVPSLDVAARIAAAVGIPLEKMISQKPKHSATRN